MISYKRELQEGINIISIPSGEPIRLETLFPKELSGATIERLNHKGKWCNRESIQYENHEFEVSEEYKFLQPLETIRLDLPREVSIDWSIKFISYTRLLQAKIDFQSGFKYEEALHLANLSNLIYEEREEIYKVLKNQYDYNHYSFYSKQSHKGLLEKSNTLKKLLISLKGKKSIVDLQFMHLSRVDENGRNIIVIIFRGSQEIEDWLTNFHLGLDNFYKRGEIHGGFNEAFELFLQTIQRKDLTSIELPKTTIEDLKKINENTTVILAGHSKGGALATLAGCHLIEQGLNKENLEIYTFGAPGVGSKEFCDYYHKRLNLYRVVNQDDPIPKIGSLIGLNHLGNKIELPSNDGEKHACEDYINNIIEFMHEENSKS